MSPLPDDRHWLGLALDLAAKGRYTCAPNPMVGAVVVCDDACVGQGWHRRPGEPHAEINALHEAAGNARGATLVVSLEPCSTSGRTPPCTDAIIAAGIARVVVGTLDPNPAHRGRGLDLLLHHGIAVELVNDPAAERLNEKFNHFMGTGMPFVHAKWAMSLDGKSATRSRDARWISGESSRGIVHRMRAEHEAVMVGIGTVLADNPRLDVRLDGEWRQQEKVVVDSSLRTPADALLLKGAPAIIACRMGAEPARKDALEAAGARVIELPAAGQGVDLRALLSLLGRENITSVLVEGGSMLLGGLFDRQLVQRVTVFIAPMVIGGQGAPGPVAGGGVEHLASALRLTDIETRQSDGDLLVSGRVSAG